MYFEPPKKTYYRFPSTHNRMDIDSKLYFPEKPSYAEDSTRFDARLTDHVPERETYYDI